MDDEAAMQIGAMAAAADVGEVLAVCAGRARWRRRASVGPATSAMGEKEVVDLPAAEDLGQREVDVSPEVGISARAELGALATRDAYACNVHSRDA